MRTMENNKALNLEDVKILIEKAYAIMQLGKEIMIIGNNLGVIVTVYNAERNRRVFLIPCISETTRDAYNECITYLEKLAGEKHDN